MSEKQSAQVARIIDELKTERAQAAVDERRSISQFADALSAESFDEKTAAEASERRSKSAERLGAAVAKALREIHAVLDAEQRETFAYLLRSGQLGI